MRLGLGFVFGAAAATWPGIAIACSCTWFFGNVEEAELRAAAAAVDLIVVGEVVSETTSAACRGKAGVEVPVYRTLRVGRIIKGAAAPSIEVEVGRVTPTARGCAQQVASCDVRPDVAAKGTWALMRKNETWEFAGVCTTDAVRRLAVIDKQVRRSGAGGQADAVRRYENKGL